MGLDVLEIVLEVEEEFQIKIDERNVERLVTVGQLYEHVIQRLPIVSPLLMPQSEPVETFGVTIQLAQDQFGNPLPGAWYKLVAIIAQQLWVDPKIVRQESNFVTDLGMD